MPKITYITPDGARHDVDVENGYSVMEGAINNNIQGRYFRWLGVNQHFKAIAIAIVENCLSALSIFNPYICAPRYARRRGNN